MKTLLALKETGLPVNEAITLCYYAQNPDSQQVDLAAAMGWSAPMASQLTGRCVRKKVLKAKAVKCPESGRRVNIYLPTAKGKKWAAKLGK
jgi:DNA-binding MarR family transcriptional regulator